MCIDREEKSPKPPRVAQAPDDRFDEALRAVTTADEETSSDDADASIFLERLPVATSARRRTDDR
jgi:hypothetical protein